MQTEKMLTVISLSALGLCVLLGLLKMMMKDTKKKRSCDTACSMLVFVAVVMLAVNQMMHEHDDDKK